MKSDGDRRELPSAYPLHGSDLARGKPGMITICKAVLSGSAPARIREQTAGLEPGWLDRFTRQPGQTLPVTEPPDVQDAVAVVRAILLDDPAP